jgi:glycosyltransferase involved in cell wall biosynthesis
MKIVYCIPHTFRPGGIERIISIKANYLAERMNFEVYIVTNGQQGHENYYSFSEKIHFFDLGINYEEALTLPFALRIVKRHSKRQLHKIKLKNLLFEIKADIVISTFTHEADFLTKIKDGSKKILEFHFFKGHKVKYANSFQFPFFTKLAFYFRNFVEENFIVNRYDQFVVLTEEDKELWKNKVDNVIAIPNILPFENATQSTLLNKQVIAVGRLDAQKGFDRLIDIWQEVELKCPGWKLSIFGEGVDKEYLENQITQRSLGNSVKIYPPTQNILEKYRESSVFVMTSRYEGMPMTMLEAMCVGLPCLTYTFKCGPIDIINNNLDGILVAENDKDNFVSALIWLIKNESNRIEMGNKAFHNIKRYSTDIVMKKWIELFTGLVGN